MDNKTSSSPRHPVLFHGRAGEYFSIWLVNVLLTLITLGIYSAWATVRRRRYFYGNTEIAGDRFDYHARPIDILKGRIIVFIGLALFFILSAILPSVSLIFLLAFCALIPWIIIRSWRYNALMSSFRGVRFNYHCRIGRAYWTIYLAPLLMIAALYLVTALLGFSAATSGSPALMVTLGVLIFVLLLVGLAAVQGVMAAMKQDLYTNNMAFGQLPFHAELSKKVFIKTFLISFLIMLPFLIFSGLLIGSLLVSIISASAMGVSDPETVGYLLGSNILNIFLAFVVLIFGILVSSSYLVAAQRNYVFGQIRLGKGLRLQSLMSTGAFAALMLTNMLIIIFTLGLGTPVAEVRLARYLANSTVVEGDLSLQEVTAHHDSTRTAVAEEVATAFDLSPGI